MEVAFASITQAPISSPGRKEVGREERKAVKSLKEGTTEVKEGSKGRK
jgi:hypothetical protein